MQLFYPAFCGIKTATVDHDEGGELLLFLQGGLGATADLVIDAAGFGFGAKVVGGLRQAVIAQASSDGMEGVVALFQCAEETTKSGDIMTSRGGQFFHVGIKKNGLVNLQEIVRTEGRENFGGCSRSSDGFVMDQRIGGIIRGADDLDLEVLQDSAGTPVGIGEAGICLLPDARGGGRSE